MGNKRGEWKVFYSISACQALLNCCVGCLVTVILRDTSAESVLNKTPTIFPSILCCLCSFFFFHLSVSGYFYKWILFKRRGRKRRWFFKDRISLLFLDTDGEGTLSRSCDGAPTARQQGGDAAKVGHQALLRGGGGVGGGRHQVRFKKQGRRWRRVPPLVPHSNQCGGSCKQTLLSISSAIEMQYNPNLLAIGEAF